MRVLVLCCAFGAPTAAARRPEPESATMASPRTLWSVHSAREEKTWRQCHDAQASKAAANVPGPPGTQRVALIGDSLMESWTGRTYCMSVPKYRGVTALAQQFVAAPVVLAIAGDHTQHLLWRLQHGELVPSMAADPALVSVLLIGTNNLGAGHTVDQVVAGVEAAASLLLNRTRGRLILHGLLPRGDAHKRPKAPIVGHAADGRPLCSFLPAIAAVNRKLNASVTGGALAREHPNRVSYAECGGPFYATGPAEPGEAGRRCPRGAAARDRAAEGGRRLGSKPRPPSEVALDLMPDGIHPNYEGHEVWARCLGRLLPKAPGQHSVI